MHLNICMWHNTFRGFRHTRHCFTNERDQIKNILILLLFLSNITLVYYEESQIIIYYFPISQTHFFLLNNFFLEIKSQSIFRLRLFPSSHERLTSYGPLILQEQFDWKRKLQILAPIFVMFIGLTHYLFKYEILF